MPDLSAKLGLWSSDTSTLLGNLHPVQDLGFEYLVCQIVVHPAGPAVPYQAAELQQVIADAGTIDLPVYAWAYVYPTGIDQQIDAIAGALPDECANLVLDAEVEWETAAGAAGLAGQLAHGIAEATGHRAALHLSSFYDPDMHNVPVAAFLEHCESFMPQAYRVGQTPVATIMSRTLAECPPLAVNSVGGLLIPTVNQPQMLAAVAADFNSFDGANVWLWDGSGSDVGVSGHSGDWGAAIEVFAKASS